MLRSRSYFDPNSGVVVIMLKWWFMISLWGMIYWLELTQYVNWALLWSGLLEKCSLGGNINYVQPSWLKNMTFVLFFDHEKKAWTAKWKGNKAPDQLHNTIAEYTVSDKSRAAYEAELETWIANGWLIPYPPRTMPPPKDWSCWWLLHKLLMLRYSQWMTIEKSVLRCFHRQCRYVCQTNEGVVTMKLT